MFDFILFIFKFNLNYFLYEKYFLYVMLKWGLGIGDWGLGIGDWAQSPIPNIIKNLKNNIIIKNNKNLFQI